MTSIASMRSGGDVLFANDVDGVDSSRIAAAKAKVAAVISEVI